MLDQQFALVIEQGGAVDAPATWVDRDRDML